MNMEAEHGIERISSSRDFSTTFENSNQ